MEWTGSPQKKMSSSFTVFDENTHNNNYQQVRVTSCDCAYGLADVGVPTEWFPAHGLCHEFALDNIPICEPCSTTSGTFLPPPSPSFLLLPNSNTSHHHENLSHHHENLFLSPTTDCTSQRFGNMVQNNDDGEDLMAAIMAKIRLREADGAQVRATSPTGTDPYSGSTAPASHSADEDLTAHEVYRLQRELDRTKERMAQMNLQLDQSRLAQHTMQEAIGSPFPHARRLAANIPVPGLLSAGNQFSQPNDFSRISRPFERSGYSNPSHS